MKKLKNMTAQRRAILRVIQRKRSIGSGTTGTMPLPMMFDIARKFQPACLATDAGVDLGKSELAYLQKISGNYDLK